MRRTRFRRCLVAALVWVTGAVLQQFVSNYRTHGWDRVVRVLANASISAVMVLMGVWLFARRKQDR